MMKSVYVKILLLTALALVLACRKEAETPAPVPEIQTLHYKVTVQAGAETRATLADNNMTYVYEEGDRVYMESVDGNGEADGKMYGFLSMSVAAGVGKNLALFEGDLTCEGGFQPANDTPVKLVLVGQYDQLHTISGGKVTGTNYENKWAPSLKEAVSQLSHFTGTGKFGDTGFTLGQKSSFLNCNVRIKKADAPVGSTVTAKLFNDNSDAPIREATITVEKEGVVAFVFAFLGGSITLSDAVLHVEWGDSQKGFPVSGQSLATNNYYTISRSTLEYSGFRIRAKYDKTEMTFRYTDGSVQFSTDIGETWTDYDGRTFNLSANEEVCFKGNRYDCDCNGSGNQLFYANNVCYIAGDITSLLADPTQLADNAFRSAFSKGDSNSTSPGAVTWVDIDSKDPLILPAFTAKNCYREMFRNCTSLTSVPALPATVVAPQCYFNMFRSCSGLKTADIELPAETMTEDCYREIFRQCTNLTSVPIFRAATLAPRCYQQMLSGCSKLGTVVCLATNISAKSCLENWMQGIKSTGTFYKSPDMPLFAPGQNGIPSGWTVTDYQP